MSDQKATLATMHRSELEATIVSQTKVMERFRNKLGSIVLGIEDEGDRSYFGSTNDADELREIESAMLDSLNILECPWMHGRDLFAELRELRAERDRLLNPPKHQFWGAGEPNCPPEIKAGNGELHTLRCKVCGQDSPRDDRCLAEAEQPA